MANNWGLVRNAFPVAGSGSPMYKALCP